MSIKKQNTVVYIIA